MANPEKNPAPTSVEEAKTPPKTENAAFYFFLYLIQFIALGFTAGGVGSVLFYLISSRTENPIDPCLDIQAVIYQEGLQFGIAAILIASPIFFILAWLINRHLFEGKIRNNAPVRRWLIYIVLVATGMTVITDLVQILITYLNGTLATPFLLKSLTVLVLAAMIFAFYLWDINKKTTEKVTNSANSLWFFSAIVICVAVLVVAFINLESPETKRLRNNDRDLINNIYEISNTVNSFVSSKHVMPKDLNELTPYYTLDVSINKKFIDQVTYKVTGDRTYQLCADFATDNQKEAECESMGRYKLHQVGYQCLDYVAIENDGMKKIPPDNTIPAEVTPSPTPTATPTPTVTPKPTVTPAPDWKVIDQQAAESMFQAKYGDKLKKVTVAEATENHMRGGVVVFTDDPEMPTAGANFLAAKVDGVWVIVSEGNGTIDCNKVKPYHFPADMIKDCV